MEGYRGLELVGVVGRIFHPYSSHPLPPGNPNVSAADPGDHLRTEWVFVH